MSDDEWETIEVTVRVREVPGDEYEAEIECDGGNETTGSGLTRELAVADALRELAAEYQVQSVDHVAIRERAELRELRARRATGN